MLTIARRAANFILGRDPLILPDARVAYTVLGSRYGGWPAIADLINSHSVVYSFGIGFDVSFDLALIEQFGCKIYAFDPTPRSVHWLSQQKLPSNFIAIPTGLAAHDGFIRLTPPDLADHVSFSMKRNSSNRDGIEVRARRLSTLMSELGHQSIDLLKLDIEGSEYAAIDDMLNSNIFPRQLNVEFHHGNHGWRASHTRTAVARMRQVGYSCFYVGDTGREMGFLRQ